MERLIVKNLAKEFKIGFAKKQFFLQRMTAIFSGREPRKAVKALDNVSFAVNAGEILGITGPNGCGKSTLLRIIAGIYEKTSGEIIANGKIISLINLYAGLKERLNMEENVFLLGALFGMDKKEIRDKFSQITQFAGLQNYTAAKVYQFSEGMKQRLVFSVAGHARPDILLLDEVFEIGDDDFKQKSAAKIKELADGGASIILASHDLNLLQRSCHRIISLKND